MSEFRIFCIVAMIAISIIIAAVNFGLIPDPKDGAAGVLVLGLMVGFGAIAVFGRRPTS